MERNIKIEKLIDDEVGGDDGENVKKNDNKTVMIVFFSLVIDLLAFTMILPLMPALMDYYQETDKQGLYSWLMSSVKGIQEILKAPDRFSSVLFGGFLGSMFSFMQFLSMPIVGALSDVYGRKSMMIICLSGISLSYLLWAVSNNFLVFVLARFVGGISKGNISLAMAIITDVTTPKTRGKSMALVGIAFSIGFILGPIVGVTFTRINTGSGYWYFYPALFAFLLSIVDLVYFIYCFEETLSVKRRAKSLARGISGAFIYINPLDLFQFNGVTGLTPHELNNLRTLGYSHFLYLFTYSGLEFTITFLTHHQFGFSSMQQGYMFFVMGIIMAVIQGSYVRRIPADKTQFYSKLGLWLVIPAFIIIGIASSIITLYVGIIIYSVSTSMAVTCMMTMVSKIGPENQKGTITGIFRSLGALARSCGPIIASLAFWSIGSTSTYLIGSVVLIFPPLIVNRVAL
ncbi:major facilitator superfamily domain-containing protein 10 [Microplitis mediator]|uniref:major facilitator superfamily domain-containing protein 10 n=1 Tax=Microplitis mediator TaxID=375433 RepID=UPI002553CE04|nr:major facilitator superfamily domain-containing protein 10 [Microplitis mediator]